MPNNIALGGEATQVDTYYSDGNTLVASRAINGDTSGR